LNGKYNYPWYELEETSIRVLGVCGNTQEKSDAKARFLHLLQDIDIPRNWRQDKKSEYERLGLFGPFPPIP
jgi:hypothetical protein